MTWQYSVGVVGVGFVFFFAWMAWEFIDRSKDYPMHQGVGLALLAVSFVLTWLNTAMVTEVVQEAAVGNTAVTTLANTQYQVTVVVGVLIMIYFGLMVMFGPMKGAIERRKFKL